MRNLVIAFVLLVSPVAARPLIEMSHAGHWSVTVGSDCSFERQEGDRVQRTALSSREVERMLAAFEKGGFFQLRDSYAIDSAGFHPGPLDCPTSADAVEQFRVRVKGKTVVVAWSMRLPPQHQSEVKRLQAMVRSALEGYSVTLPGLGLQPRRSPAVR